MEDLQKYCEEYNFSEVLKEFRDEFYGKKEVRDFLVDAGVSEGEEVSTFFYFTNLFWDNYYTSHQRIAKFVSLPNNIKWHDVVKAHPTEEYISFLKKVYSAEQSLKSLGEEYLLEKDEISALMLPIKVVNQNVDRIHCNGFYLKRASKNKNLYMRYFTDYSDR